MKVQINFWSKGNKTRFYINDENRQSLGFFEEIEVDKHNCIYRLEPVGIAPELLEKLTEKLGSENVNGDLLIDASDLKPVANGVIRYDNKMKKLPVLRNHTIEI